MFAELGVTTNFSFLRGASHPEELVGMASGFGLAGLGIADRNSLAGVVRAHVFARDKLNKEGNPIRVVVGARLVFADGTPDILAYPTDRDAYGRLTRLLTRGNRRAEKGSCILRLGDLLDFIEGLQLIVMDRSTAEDDQQPAPRRRRWCGAASRHGRPDVGSADRTASIGQQGEAAIRIGVHRGRRSRPNPPIETDPVRNRPVPSSSRLREKVASRSESDEGRLEEQSPSSGTASPATFSRMAGEETRLNSPRFRHFGEASPQARQRQWPG